MVTGTVAFPFFASASPRVLLSPTTTQLLLLASLLCALLLVTLTAALYLRKRRGSREALSLVGRTASVEEPLSPEGSVLVGGELWRALSASGGHVGRGSANVRIVGARGHLLLVVELGNVDAPS